MPVPWPSSCPGCAPLAGSASAGRRCGAKATYGWCDRGAKNRPKIPATKTLRGRQTVNGLAPPRAFRSGFLEPEASRKGYVRGLNLRALYRTEGRVGVGGGGEVQSERSVRIARTHVVEGVEGFHTELQNLPFRDAGILGQGQIHRPQPRPVEESRRRIADAERVRPWQGGNCRGEREPPTGVLRR